MPAAQRSVPGREQAAAYLSEAERLNPGPWVGHSIHAAQAAEAIAARCSNLDPERVYALGLLHDIGRRAGVTDMRHALDGYHFLLEQGYPDAARICLTHSFPIKQVHSAAGKWDCSPAELRFIQAFLDGVEYTDEDRLIQLCDALALPTGICRIEVRLVDVTLRHGFNDWTLPRWREFLNLQAYFEELAGASIYSLLPGIVEGVVAKDGTPSK